MTSGHPAETAISRPDRQLSVSLVCTALAAAVIGSVGAPLITAVATGLHVSLDAAQWTLTVTLFTGAIAGPVLGRLGSGPARRATILATMSLVAVGGILTVIAAPLWVLLVGRGLQGLAVGVVALLMSVAREHLSPQQSPSTIAALSVASTVGIGVGYPLVSFVDQATGLRAAYGIGLALSVVALIVAWRSLPAEKPGPRPTIDVGGASTLAVGMFGVLLIIADPALWQAPGAAVAVVVGALVAIAAFVAIELRSRSPLVNLRLLGRARLLRANLAMLIAAVGLYLLFSLMTRYVQTPPAANYGFALPGIAAGASLIPFSLLGFVAARTTPLLRSRRAEGWAYALSAMPAIAAAAVFVIAHNSLAAVLVAVALLGYAVGGISAAMPELLLVDVPQDETSSVLSINQIVRAMGFSAGSAVAGFLLASATPPDSLFPTVGGYESAALWAIAPLVLSVVVVVTRSDRPYQPSTC